METLPDDWEIRPLHEVATFASGGTPSKARPEWWTGTVPWVSPKDMKVPRLDSVTDHITEEAATAGSRLVPAKSIFVVVRGMVLAKAVPVAIAERPMAFNQDMKAVIARDGIDPDFLFYAIRHQTPTLTREISTSAHGTRRMGAAAVESLRVALPRSPFEQSRIVEVLRRLEDAVAVQGRVVAGLRDLKAATMAKLFSEGLRGESTRQTEIGPIPRNWDVRPIGDLVERAQYGLSIRGGRTGRYPILRMNCQVDGRVVMRDLQYIDVDDPVFEAYRIRKGDLLFNRTNSIDLVGRTAISKSDLDAVFASYLVRLTPTAAVVPGFLNYYLNLPSTQAAVKGLATRAVGQANVSASKLKSFKVPVSRDKDEEQEIAAAIDTIGTALSSAVNRRTALVVLLAATLSALMSGETRVTSLLEE